MGKVATALTSLALLVEASVALDSIVSSGTKFFTTSGTQFYFKGVAYQQNQAAAGASNGNNKFTDPLASASNCQRDVPILKALGANVIRTYAIDPTADHSACMQLLSDAGIYVISDLSEPNTSIQQDNPGWDLDLFDRYKAVVDELSKYSNTIGFFAGNEVTNNATNTPASSYVKAAVRDVKAYIKSTKSRWLGVGYAANDDKDIRANIAQFFNCGPQEQAIDYWGYNIYEWCGDNTFEGSGYKAQVDFFSNYSVPVFFAEYGCNTQGGAEGRIWEETTALYSDQMTGVMSGGIVYMYFEEANDFGLVKLDGSTANTMKNYDALKTKLAAATPSAVASSAYKPSNTPQACPPVNDAWKASSVLPPTPDRGLCECMYNTINCAPKAGLATDDYGDIFDYICAHSPASCAGINGNSTTGVYGAYSMCNSTQKLGAVLQAYYLAQNSATTACDFNGKAVVQKAAGAASTCSAALSSASAANSVAATASTGSSPTGSGSSSHSSTNVAAPIPMKNLLTVGDLAIGMYVVVAMVAGAGMVML